MALLLLIAVTVTACTGGAGSADFGEAQSCMQCHNASQKNDYAGPGIENPHPFAGAGNLLCTTCHGGNGQGSDKDSSHVPPPPEIGDRDNLENDREAYFNRLTLTGIDKYDDYQVGNKTYSALDYLQFINPGDLRVVSNSRSCGKCHQGHAECVQGSVLATETGVFSGAMFSAGVENAVPENQGLYEDTAADLAFRAITDSDPEAALGAVARLFEFPVYSTRGETEPDSLFNNDLYDAAGLSDDRHADNSLITGSPLANLYHEQVAFTCGDCHLGSAGANNRYGDFRSSGCTSCHMPYSLDGRSGSKDPNVDKFEPADPDDIEAPERSHVRSHVILSTARQGSGGEMVPGIDDYACAGCHQGSNRTVMQYWGIRLDQNADLHAGVQYPANPDSFQNTHGDTRLFDPVVGNNTFNGRNRNQYILFEDYDGDGKDDTPADVHYEAGMGCIDCHGSADLHGGYVDENPGVQLFSRMEHSVSIQCESCHGSSDAYAPTATGLSHAGTLEQLALDENGRTLDHVVKEGSDYFLYSKLTGARHYVPQTRDTVLDSGKLHPDSGDPIYNAKASYAMGRADGIASTGIGPLQDGVGVSNFKHGDSMSCASCHSSWTNNCIGCHLEGEYNGGNNFSNITGDRIVFRERNADFVYQSPVFFQLGVGPEGLIDPIAPNTETFFKYRDRHGDFSETFAFSDRNGQGNNNLITPFPSLSHNVMMPHSIRGKVEPLDEGPRYCVACHLTEKQIDDFGPQYDTFRTALATDDFGSLDFNLLRDHIGKNTGNQMDSPFWVHMAAGLGSGLFLFDEHGCPVNPLDDDDDRKGCNGVSPADNFDLANVAFNLDRIVMEDGTATGSNSHPLENPGGGPANRDGSQNPNLSGPLGATTIRRLTDPDTGIVLNSWLDADGVPQGEASGFLGGGP